MFLSFFPPKYDEILNPIIALAGGDVSPYDICNFADATDVVTHTDTDVYQPMRNKQLVL